MMRNQVRSDATPPIVGIYGEREIFISPEWDL